MASRNFRKRWMFHTLFRLKGSILPQLIPRAIIAAGIVSLLRLGFPSQFIAEGSYLMWHPTPFSYFLQLAIFSVAFHTNQAYNRYWEARTQVQSMSSYWGDLISQLISYDEQNINPDTVADGPAWRAKIAHLVSLLHAVSIQYLLNRYADCVELEVLGGVSEAELKRLSITSDQSFLVSHWILQACAMRQNNGGLNVPGPITSRSWQVISLGMLSFNQACKIEDTPFPFPYVQLLYIMDWCMSFVIPFVVASWVKDTIFAAVLSILAVCTFQAMFATACIMENPFGQTPNDLPLQQLHDDFVTRIKTLLDYSVAIELHNMIIKNPKLNKQGLNQILGQSDLDEMHYKADPTKYPHLLTGTNLPTMSEECSPKKSIFSRIRNLFQDTKKRGTAPNFGLPTESTGTNISAAGNTHLIDIFVNSTDTKDSKTPGSSALNAMVHGQSKDVGVQQQRNKNSGVDLSAPTKKQRVKMHLGTSREYKMGDQTVQGIILSGDNAYPFTPQRFQTNGEIEKGKSTAVMPSRGDSQLNKSERGQLSNETSHRSSEASIRGEVTGKTSQGLITEEVTDIEAYYSSDSPSLRFDRSFPLTASHTKSEMEHLSVNSGSLSEGFRLSPSGLAVRKNTNSYAEVLSNQASPSVTSEATQRHSNLAVKDAKVLSHTMECLQDDIQMDTAVCLSSQSALPTSAIRRMGTMRLAKE